MEKMPLSPQQQHCLNACLQCATMCEVCADDMVGMEHNNHHDLMTRCIRLCRDCADLCFVTAKLVSRRSPQLESLSEVCAEMCDQCAELCEQHAPHHALCSSCAEECRRCADACRELVGTGAHISS